MSNETLIKLMEALASFGYKIISLSWKEREEPPFGQEIEIKLFQPLGKT